MLPGKPRQRLALAIAAAVSLHLGFLALLALLPRRRELQQEAPKAPMQVSLLHAKRAQPAPAQVAPPPEPKPAPAAKKSRRAPETTAQGRPAAIAPADASSAGAVKSAAKPPPPSPSWSPWSHDWLVAEGVHREGAPPGGLQIDLDHPAAQLGPGRPQPEAAPLGPVHVPTREEALAEEHDRVEARVGGWLSETKARDRAGPGRDAGWQSLENALGKGFSPGWDVIDEGPPRKSALRDVLDAWQKQAEAYGKSGNPFAGSKDAPGAQHELPRDLPVLANEDRGLGSRSLEGFGGWWLGAGIGGASGAGSGFTQRLVSLVRVTQREDGSIIAIELAGSSGNLVYDKIVLKKAYALRSLQLAPPKQGLESLWAFETRFTRVPPMPIAGCALDESFLPKDCWYPLQKRTESSVHLQAIY